MSGSWSGSPGTGPLGLDFAPLARGRPVVLLDRDGVLNAAVEDPESGLPESPLCLEDVRLLPGAALAAQDLVTAGRTLACVSNQPAAAKGKVSVEQLLAIHERVLALLSEEGVQIGVSRLCLHHPEGVVEQLSRRCECRKPGAAMLVQVAAVLQAPVRSSWMLGDTDTDVAAGLAAGCRTVLLEYPPSAHKRSGQAGQHVLADGLAEGVSRLLQEPMAWP